MVQTATPASAATGAVVDLWDRLVAMAERIGPQDWGRSTPWPGTDVATVVSHVTGAAAVAGDPLPGLRAARDGEVARLLARHPTPPSSSEDAERARVRRERLLAASCLDLWVHGYDLATALGQPVDLDEDSPAVRAAAAYVLRFAPHLLAGRTGAGEGATLRLGIEGPDAEEVTATVRGGRGVITGEPAVAGAFVTAKPTALMLLLSGRGEPEQWREAGGLAWSGAAGEAFVRHARLL